MSDPYLFAGDRGIAVTALCALIEREDPPAVLCISDRYGASHAAGLREVFRAAGGDAVITGSELRSPHTVEWLKGLNLSFGLSVHFPDLVRRPALRAPRRGWLNLHPAYLPYNRGWHTPSWAILEQTPAGATLHEMAEAVDAGAIVAQREVPVSPGDTAHTLYQRLLDVEVDLLLSTWTALRQPEPWATIANDPDRGTAHHSRELSEAMVRELDLDRSTTPRQVLDHLRALTTDRWSEAAEFETDGRRFRVRVEFQEVEEAGDRTLT